VESQEVRTAVVGVLRPTIGRLTDEMLTSVVEAVPPFQEWWGASPDVRDGVEQGLRGFPRPDTTCPRHVLVLTHNHSALL
jgi:hypothetical protein